MIGPAAPFPSFSLTALDEGVPDVVPDARADGAVLGHAALGVDPASRVPAGVSALVVDAVSKMGVSIGG